MSMSDWTGFGRVRARSFVWHRTERAGYYALRESWTTYRRHACRQMRTGISGPGYSSIVTPPTEADAIVPSISSTGSVNLRLSIRNSSTKSGILTSVCVCNETATVATGSPGVCIVSTTPTTKLRSCGERRLMHCFGLTTSRIRFAVSGLRGRRGRRVVTAGSLIP